MTTLLTREDNAPPAEQRLRRVVTAAPAYVPVVMIAVAGWSHRWMNEDAYINLRIVDQVLAGHGPVFNAGERIESATSPLWLGILVVGRALVGPFLRAEWIAVIASLLAAIGAFALAGKAARVQHENAEGVVVPVGLFLVAAVAVVWDFSTSGLEMGVVWLWLATSWYVLVRAARSEVVVGRVRTGFCLILGLGPLVRPELGLMTVCFLAAWFVLARPRRIGGDVLAIFALPVVYQVFRMGYYASVVPTTALAKDAGGLHFGQGWEYAKDFTGPYRLWVTAVLLVVAMVAWHVRTRDRRLDVAVVAMVGGAALNALYIVAIGGDYMHGRLLLPAFFAFALPASISVRRQSVGDLAFAGAAAVWATITLFAFRPPPVQPVFGVGVTQVSDWRAISGAKVVLDDAALGLNGHEAAAAYRAGLRGYFTVAAKEPRPAADPNAFVLTLGSIGVPAYDAGRRVWVVDIGGLAEPLAARTQPVPDRPAGHRKQVDPAWYDARFAAPNSNDSPQVLAARRALGCGKIASLLEAVDGDLTPARFFSNIWDSIGFTTLDVPSDPVVAEQRFCSPR